MRGIADWVNVFQGNGKIDLPPAEGIASKWLFIKAQVGNTHPHASYPFGKMSAGAYTGGYPTGYGNLRPSSHGECPTFDAKVHGFAHIHQTGTGAIGYYYNYALVSPGVGELAPLADTLADECAEPGYYAATLSKSGVRCEMTVSSAVATHRYRMPSGGRLQIDMANNGCAPEFGPRFSTVISEAELHLTSSTTATARIVTKKGGVALYFAFECPCARGASLWVDYKRVGGDTATDLGEERRYGFVFDTPADAELRVAYSFVSTEAAERQLLEHSEGFDEMRVETRAVWERYLGRIEIDADDEIREIFYSNLYHSLLKPSSTLGESFIGECKYFDFCTLWDMYKTAIPLILTLYPEEAEGIARTFLSAIAVRDRSPISMQISYQGDIAMQARMLMEHSLADYYFRYGELASEILDAAEKDLAGQTDFLECGLCERYTHVLDITEALGAMAEIAREIGDGREERFASLASGWRRVYDTETGLLSSASNYYEGTAANYSFRQLREMDERVRITGDVGDFIAAMDELFGYTRERVEQHRNCNVDPLTLGINSFEGFNNESDMEAPYSYVWVGQHYKTAEIVRGGMKYMYTRGRGGIPGNNDTGSLSSNYVWSALGLFPIAGQNLMVIGSPIVRSARLHLGTGGVLDIRVEGDPATMTYVESAELNGAPISGYRFSTRDMMKGGELVIRLTDKRPEL